MMTVATVALLRGGVAHDQPQHEGRQRAFAQPAPAVAFGKKIVDRAGAALGRHEDRLCDHELLAVGRGQPGRDRRIADPKVFHGRAASSTSKRPATCSLTE